MFSMTARLLLWMVMAVWSLFALTLGAIHLIIVPRIDDWRPALERWATHAVGVPVKVGAIRAETQGADAEQGWAWLPALVPAFELRDVRLYDPAGREALQLPQINASLSVRSLWRLGFEQLVIDSPTLDVHRTADSRILVAGLDFSGPAEQGRGGADWFFSQTEFVIRGGTVRWTDDLRQQPPLALGELNLVVRNTARSHQFRLDATPPPEWGQRLSLRGRLREPLLSFAAMTQRQPDAAPWDNWSGELFADFAQVDVSRLQAYVDLSAWNVSVRSGQGALRAWADLNKGRITGATVDLSLQQFATRLGAQLPELAISSLRGRMSAQWDVAGFAVASDNLQFTTTDGQAWPGGVLRLTHQRAQARKAASSQLTADRVDLAALAAIATRLPLPDASRALLLRLQPAGQLEDLRADWQGAPPAGDGSAPADALAAAWQPDRYRATGKLVALALTGEPRAQAPGEHILPGRPGVRGANADFDLNQDGGTARLVIEGGAVDLPGVFAESLVPMQRLETQARWAIKGERIDAWFEKLSLANADTEGTGSVHWHTSDPKTSNAQSRFPGVLDLSVRLTRGTANRVYRYLPIAVGPDTQRYVQAAVSGGQVGPVDFRINGELWDVPYNLPGAQGEFRIAAQLQSVDFAYVPAYLQAEGDLAWPGLKGVNGQLVLDRASLQLSGLTASIDGAPAVRLSQAEVGIADLVKDPLLTVSASAQGPANDVVAYVRRSPVHFFTGQVLERATISGATDVKFKLQLPLNHIDKTAVQGSVAFTGNDVRISPDTPMLARTVGQLTFSEHGFNIPAARSQIYGGELRFEGGMSPSPQGAARIRFKGQGTATAEGLRNGELGLVSRLVEQASGSAAYTAELGFRAGVSELNVRSNLQGMASSLPAPLSKAAADSLPLHYDNRVLTVSTEASGEVARTDRFFLQLGEPAQPLATLDYERSLSAGAEPRVVRGSIAGGLALGESVPMPAAGVQANIRFPQIDADAWERSFARITGVDPHVTTSGANKGTTGAEDDSASLRYLPTNLAVRTEHLLVGGRTFNNLVIGGSREGGQWRANVNAEQLNGYLEYRQPSGNSAGSIYARLAKLTLAPSAKAEVEQLLQQPNSMPALDIEVDDFVLAGRQLGFVAIQAQNQGREGRAREWRLTKLNLRVPEARFNAIGDWALSPATPTTGNTTASGTRRTALQVELDIRDAGALLTRFGQPGTVRGGQGTINGTVGWVGSPMSLDYASLSGQLHVDIKTGQFLKVDPGAAKLLSVLSLQALPRRLVLDFRDFFSEGFAFDFVRGDATIAQGVARTNNLQMKGINAAVLMDGSADIANETQDLKVVVVPEINAGTAALIATAINPAIGLGTFLAQYLLSQPLQSAATQEFHITGGWTDPQVDKVDRRAAASKPASTPPRSLQ
ncbi:YhdP family protein [Hydrogenophaga sp. PAMC20947]|uniref:YhdP family protein n=1 Tax=Hydrogenophaga sp. PAMC20947 TaxID=2565558 RepID=UPI001FF9967F|nr:YhdP family protein [Hydrogenophaga sp. PAMC20947]